MSVEIDIKYVDELKSTEISQIASQISDNVYDGFCSRGFLREVYLSDPNILCFLGRNEGSIVASFLTKELPKIESVCYLVGCVEEGFRVDGIYKKMITERERHFKSESMSHVATKTNNPLIVSILEPHGYYYPKERIDKELIGQSKNIFFESHGIHVNDNMVIDGREVETYPCIPRVESIDDRIIMEYMQKNLVFERGDRLVLVKRLK